MRFLFFLLSIYFFVNVVTAQEASDEKKLVVLGGVTVTGSEFVFWEDNVVGGNLQLVYELKRFSAAAIGVKVAGGFSDGFSG